MNYTSFRRRVMAMRRRAYAPSRRPVNLRVRTLNENIDALGRDIMGFESVALTVDPIDPVRVATTGTRTPTVVAPSDPATYTADPENVRIMVNAGIAVPTSDPTQYMLKQEVDDYIQYFANVQSTGATGGVSPIQTALGPTIPTSFSEAMADATRAPEIPTTAQALRPAGGMLLLGAAAFWFLFMRKS